jgi:hypothetical protein
MGNGDSLPYSPLKVYEIGLTAYERRERIPHNIFGSVQKLRKRDSKKIIFLREILLSEDEEIRLEFLKRMESFMKPSHKNLLKPLGIFPLFNPFKRSRP